MTDIERFMVETVSYALDFKKTVLFCRLCGGISTTAAAVRDRQCAHCHVWHDNVALERNLRLIRDGGGS